MRKDRNGISRFGIKSRKSLGQHFLINETVLRKIVDLAQLAAEDYVLEIGPGTGNLTKYLVRKARKVFAIELDKELAAVLKSLIPNENLEIIQADVLKYNIIKIKPKEAKLKVISNLPYNISTQVIFKMLESGGIFSELYLMLQKEVAERIVAEPGIKDYGILAVVAGLFSQPEMLLTLGPEVFKPRPKVESALVKFKILDEPRFPVADYNLFKKMVRACFAMRRKMIRNSLRKSRLGLALGRLDELLAQAGIAPTARPETISLEKLVKLANLYCEERK